MELFAQLKPPAGANNAAFQVGAIVGAILAVLVCASIPLVLGIKRGHPIIGVIGAIIAAGTSVFLGCLGGLPAALVFVVVILVMGKPEVRKKKKRKQQPVEYEEEDLQDEHDDDEDQRPGKKRT